jgi:hypothetical protein
MPKPVTHHVGSGEKSFYLWQITDALPSPMAFGQGKWLGEGVMSKWTPAVKEFASGFDLTTLDGIESLCSTVFSFRKVPKGMEELIGSYAKRTADEIIGSRRIFVKKSVSSFPRSFPQIEGCVEQALAISAALRCGKVPALFIREGNHSKVLFQYRGETIQADTYSPKLWQQRKPKDAIIITGLDPADVGMRSLEDYWIASGERGRLKKEQFLSELHGWSQRTAD